jgi:hypothetical protein
MVTQATDINTARVGTNKPFTLRNYGWWRRAMITITGLMNGTFHRQHDFIIDMNLSHYYCNIFRPSSSQPNYKNINISQIRKSIFVRWIETPVLEFNFCISQRCVTRNKKSSKY